MRLKHLEPVALNALFAARLLRNAFIRPRIETCVKIVARFSPISRFGHRSASIGGTTLGSVRECRPHLGGRHRGLDTMSVAQSQRVEGDEQG